MHFPTQSVSTAAVMSEPATTSMGRIVARQSHVWSRPVRPLETVNVQSPAVTSTGSENGNANAGSTQEVNAISLPHCVQHTRPNDRRSKKVSRKSFPTAHAESDPLSKHLRMHLVFTLDKTRSTKETVLSLHTQDALKPSETDTTSGTQPAGGLGVGLGNPIGRTHSPLS